MSNATIIYWREIPTQIVVGSGREAVRRVLSERFQVAVDKAAMVDRASGEDEYLEDWRRVPTEVDATDPEAAADALAAEIELEYTTTRLADLARHGGIEHIE
jgi:Virulence factor